MRFMRTGSSGPSCGPTAQPRKGKGYILVDNDPGFAGDAVEFCGPRYPAGRPRAPWSETAYLGAPTRATRQHCSHVENPHNGNIYKVCCPEQPYGTPWGQTCQYWKVSSGGAGRAKRAGRR